MLAVVLSASDVGGAAPKPMLRVVKAGVPPPHAARTPTADRPTNRLLNLDLNTTRSSQCCGVCGMRHRRFVGRILRHIERVFKYDFAMRVSPGYIGADAEIGAGVA